ncbi:MAG: HEAT repeat domain-containing protein [Pseudomonadota bacterium]
MRSFILTALFLLTQPALAGGFKPSKASLGELVGCLEDPDPGLREDCAEELGARGGDEAAEALLSAVEKNDSARVRLKALDALVDMRSPLAASGASLMVTRDAEVANRAHALAVAERDLGDSVAPTVIAAMRDADPTIRRKAVIIVGKRGFSEGEPYLAEQAVDDADPAVVSEAWEALTLLGNPDLRPRIHEALASGPEEVRKAVAKALRKKILPQDRDALVRALDDSCTTVVRDAAKALVELGDASVAPVLRQKAAAATDESVKKDLEKCALELGG